MLCSIRIIVLKYLIFESAYTFKCFVIKFSLTVSAIITLFFIWFIVIFAFEFFSFHVPGFLSPLLFFNISFNLKSTFFIKIFRVDTMATKLNLCCHETAPHSLILSQYKPNTICYLRLILK